MIHDVEKKLKVLMFGWEFPPFNSGGLGTACFGLTRALSIQNVSVLFALPNRMDISAPFLKLKFADDFLPGVSFSAINSILKPYVTSELYQKIRAGESNHYGLSLMEEVNLYALRAGELAAEEEFDVIHAHDWLSFGAGIEARRVSGRPLVVHVHATEFDRTGGGGVNQAVYAIEKQGLQEADRVIAISNFTKRMVVEHYAIDPQKVTVVHNGIDPAVPSAQADLRLAELQALKTNGKKIVLFVGRITLQKGPDYFVRAAAKLSRLYPDTYFVFAGSGDMETQIMREVAGLGLSDRVIFAGFLRGADLEALYRAADLFVMPSISEPFGLTALEAIQNGTPAVLSKQSGVSEVIQHALKVDFWDTDAMVNAIAGVLEYRSLTETLRENASRELPFVSWQRAAQACISIYQQLLARA